MSLFAADRRKAITPDYFCQQFDNEPPSGNEDIYWLKVTRTSRAKTVPEGDREEQKHNLPSETTTMIGRKKEVREITQLLRRENVRIVTLTGPGGIGKTRLSLHVAEDLIGDFDDCSNAEPPGSGCPIRLRTSHDLFEKQADAARFG